MSNENTILLSSTSVETWDGTSGIEYQYSDKQKAAGYHKKSSALHTAIFEFDNFLGDIKIQATLETHPSSNDWFDVEYYTGSEIQALDSTPLLTNETRNFTGNFVWVRAAYRLMQGTITQVRYTY